VIGQINFKASDDSGSDAVLVCAGIDAVSEAVFNGGVNKAKLSFRTAESEVATEKMSLSSAGVLTVASNIKSDSTDNATTTTDGSLQTDGGLSVVLDAVIGDDLFLKSDAGRLVFGADSDVSLNHYADVGLILKTNVDANNNPVHLVLQTGETAIADGNMLGTIQFQAVDESSGGDSRLVAAAIDAVAEADFTGGVNQAKLQFRTGTSEVATVKMTITNNGGIHFNPVAGAEFRYNDAGIDSDMRFESTGSSTMFFLDSGNDRIGIKEATPQYTFEVGNATDGSQGFGVNLENNSAKTYYMASAEDTQTHAVYQNGNGVVGSIKTVNSTTQFNTSSDYRLKENIDYTWDATSRLKELKPARFSFKANKDETLEEILLDGTNGSSADAGGKILFEDETHMIDGFIAHEVTGIVDAAVTGNYDSVVKWQSWETDVLPGGVSVGDDKLDGNDNVIIDPQGIDQAKLVPLLVKTIQELEARITALEA